MGNNKPKLNSLSSISSEFFRLLPLELRCEVEENEQRKDYTLLEKAEFQERLRKELQKFFPSGRKRRKPKVQLDSKNCQFIGTLESLGVDRIDDLIGKLGKVKESGERVRQRRKIFERVNKSPAKYDKILKKFGKGDTSFPTLYHSIVKIPKPQTPPFPPGTFNGIIADPPWQFDFGFSGAAKNHYSTMPTEEICELGKKIPFADNTYLFLWVPLSLIPDGVRVIDAWGFEFPSSMCWVKEENGKLQPGLGFFYVQGVHELIFIGKKGNMPLPGKKPLSVIKAPKAEHSVKPEIYDLVESFVPNGKYLELFARPKTKRPNWTYWGAEVSKNLTSTQM